MSNPETVWSIEISVLSERLLALDRFGVVEQLEALVDAQPLPVVIDEVISPALEGIGKRWDEGELALTQVYMASRICEALIGERLSKTEPASRQQCKVAITVLHDHHTLGKRTVLATLRSAGIPIVDFGHGTVEEVAARTVEEGLELLLVSVLMLPSALRVADLRDRLRAAGSSTRIAVGGAPFRFDDQLWKEVGADAMGRTSADALEIVARFTVARP